MRWKILSSINIHGTSDTVFFALDKHCNLFIKDLAILSLEGRNRIRLLNFDLGIRNALLATVAKYHQKRRPKENEFLGGLPRS